MPKVGVVISTLNFNDLTKKCVDSVITNSGIPCDIVVVDDGSNVPYVDDRVKVIRSEVPHGNTWSMNTGIVYFDNKYDYIMNLDNDIEIYPDAIRRLVDVMELQPNLALAGASRVTEQKGIVKRFGASTDLLRGCCDLVVEGDTTSLCHWVSGCAVLMRTSVIREIGMFDKRLKNYCQDAEWCLRARVNGYSIAIVPDAIVSHVGEVTMHANLIDCMPDAEEFMNIISGKYLNEILKYLPLDAPSKQYGRLTFDIFSESATA